MSHVAKLRNNSILRNQILHRRPHSIGADTAPFFLSKKRKKQKSKLNTCSKLKVKVLVGNFLVIFACGLPGFAFD